MEARRLDVDFWKNFSRLTMTHKVKIVDSKSRFQHQFIFIQQEKLHTSLSSPEQFDDFQREKDVLQQQRSSNSRKVSKVDSKLKTEEQKSLESTNENNTKT